MKGTLDKELMEEEEVREQDPVQVMTVKDFREKGYLQELNRKFLHPLGLAIEIILCDDGQERFGRIWDYREDKEGIYFDEDVIDPEKSYLINQETRIRRQHRTAALGYFIQPVPKKNKKSSRKSKKSTNNKK